MQPNECKTPLQMLYHWEQTAPDRIFLRQPVGGVWQDYSWRRAADEVRRVAAAIRKWNLPPGSHIAIASKNCAHWILSDLAIWMSGHVSVPLYPNLSPQTVRTILEHSGTKAIFLGKLDNWKSYVDGLPSKLPMIVFPYGGPSGETTWDEVLRREAPLTESPARSNDEIATIIYTSGTTGTPKGVVHKFQSFSFAATHALTVVSISTGDRFFSYLPLAHVAERLLTETVGLYAGSTIAFVESLDLFAKNLAETRPTVFLGVPRIWEKFHAGIRQKLPQAKLDKILRIPILSSLVKRKIRKGLGLDAVQICLSGAAPLAPSLIEWFAKLGIRVQEAYGLTENFAYSHYTRQDRIQVGSVGQPWPGAEIKVGEGNEIIMRSPCLMEGYYKAPDLTAEAIRDGFLHTGDQGSIDGEGFLRITGRVKELFKTAKGKYVAPAPIELRLAGSSYIDQACVVGSGMPGPLALVTLSEAGRAADATTLASALGGHMKQVNAKADPHERLLRIVVLNDTWTVENEMLTPTMKLKRNVVEKKYGGKIPDWAAAREDVIMAGTESAGAGEQLPQKKSKLS